MECPHSQILMFNLIDPQNSTAYLFKMCLIFIFNSSEDENTSIAVKNLQKKKSSIENAALTPPVNCKLIDKNGKLIPIKTICLKINNFISLRILDRRNINLQYFAGNRNIR